MSQSSTTHTTPTAQSSSALGGFGHAIKTQYEAVSSWEDANYSAKVVGCVNLAFVLLWTLNLAPLATVLYLAAITAACGLPLSRFMRWSSDETTKTEFISKQQIHDATEYLHLKIEQLADEVKHVFYWTDLKRSALITGGLLASGWLMSMVSIGTLIFLGLNAAVLRKPIVSLYYKHAEKHVQPIVDKAWNQVNTVMGKAEAACNNSRTTSAAGKNKKI